MIAQQVLPLVLVVALLIAVPASADPPLKIPAMVYTSSVAADYFTTYQNLTRPNHFERFPVPGWLLEHPKTFIAASAATEIAGWAIAHHLLGTHRRFERVALYVGAGLRFSIAADNRFRGMKTTPTPSQGLTWTYAP